MPHSLPPRGKSLRRRNAEKRLAYANVQANVDHILKAVGRRHVPRWINRRRLREDIESAREMYRTAADLDHNETWKTRTNRLKQIAKAAEQLHRLLTDDEVGRWVATRLAPGFPLGEGMIRDRQTKRPTREAAPSLRGLVSGLTRLKRLARHEVSSGRTKRRAPHRLARSPDVWLMADALPEIFERWFGRKAAPGRPHNDIEGTTGKANSPYIRFACAVLKEIGVLSNRGEPYSPETINRELQRARKKEAPRREPVSERNSIP